MKQSRSRRPLAALVLTCLLAAAAPVSAQQASDGIAGKWKFKSHTFDGDCVMSGVVNFQPSGKANTFACDFVVETHCRRADVGLHEYWRVRQSCSAKLAGKRLQVTSKITRIEDARFFNEQASLEEKASYMPDNFDVLIEIPGEQLGGRVFDPIRRVPVRLWRDAELSS